MSLYVGYIPGIYHHYKLSGVSRCRRPPAGPSLRTTGPAARLPVSVTGVTRLPASESACRHWLRLGSRAAQAAVPLTVRVTWAGPGPAPPRRSVGLSTQQPEWPYNSEVVVVPL
jgi:hypothetical protein